VWDAKYEWKYQLRSHDIFLLGSSLILWIWMGVTVNFRWRRKYHNVFQVKQHLWHLDKVECVAIVLGRIAAPALR